MDLVFIYGPPAVGKLTVAKELEKLTGYKIFHNHVTIDFALPIYEYGTKEFIEFNEGLRLQFFKEAIKANVKGVIFTFCYGNPEDNEFVKNVIEIIESDFSRVCFVQLKADLSELKKRVVMESRKRHSKIVTVKALEKFISKSGIDDKIEFKEHLAIDTDKISAEKSAKEIKEYYRLK